MSPNTGLLKIKKGTKPKFIRSDECELAFTKIKELLSSAPVLTCPDYEKTFMMLQIIVWALL